MFFMVIDSLKTALDWTARNVTCYETIQHSYIPSYLMFF